MCVWCIRERQRDRETERQRDRDREERDRGQRYLCLELLKFIVEGSDQTGSTAW